MWLAVSRKRPGCCKIKVPTDTAWEPTCAPRPASNSGVGYARTTADVGPPARRRRPGLPALCIDPFIDVLKAVLQGGENDKVHLPLPQRARVPLRGAGAGHLPRSHVGPNEASVSRSVRSRAASHRRAGGPPTNP